MENLFSDYLLPVTLGIIILGTGLSIEFRDFRNIFLYPKAVLVGLCCQMVFLPLIAFGIDLIIPLDPVYKVGLILIAACPGGATSNLVNFLLSGNVALSISITV
ncbi:MAG TPA: bile acid:sodium symporter family protein, partial [Bacteroidales bacterium]|nr:bile acid:sodium symporter family protein [Bacteroidales bacterium]